MNWSSLRKWLTITVGVIATALGLIGLFVPLLPTTPFLLLAAACFARSSERLYRWLTTRRVLGSYVRSYREHHAVALRAKLAALVLLWGTIGYGIARMAQPILRGLLLTIALGVTVHLLTLKTLTKAMLAEDPPVPAEPNVPAGAPQDNGSEGPSGILRPRNH
jgi:uncharacterized membrane protein YbaN (DUF454 family)